MDSPVNNDFILQQTYKKLYLYGNKDVAGTLSAPTYAPDPNYPLNLTYVKGQLMALYTSGDNIGQYVGYDSTGTNGQNICVGWIDDDRIPYTYPGVGKLRGLIKFGDAMVFDAQLVAKTAGDIVTGMQALGGRKYTIAGEIIWYVP